MLPYASMAPHDVEPAPTLHPDLNSPEALCAATARLRALGIDDEVVFSCTSADDLAGHLASSPRLARLPPDEEEDRSRVSHSPRPRSAHAASTHSAGVTTM
jgi:hypothetical protein